MSNATDIASRLLSPFESCELDAYPDPASQLGRTCAAAGLPMRDWQQVKGALLGQALRDAGRPWTIGWGQTGGVNPGDSISQADADHYRAATLAAVEKDVLLLIEPVQLTDHQLAALISFAYNVGTGVGSQPLAGLAGSTLLKLVRAHAALSEVGAEFAKWNHAGGKVLAGLTARRAAEAACWSGETVPGTIGPTGPGATGRESP